VAFQTGDEMTKEERNREWREAHPDYQRNYRQMHPEVNRNNVKNWRIANRDKRNAQKAVQQKIKRGLLVRQPCRICGDYKSHAHHRDYSKRFEVDWLCALHHNQEHIQQKQAK
jgi:hypothetical protein